MFATMSPEEGGAGGRAKRKQQFSADHCCPVCGCTVRPPDLMAHLRLEQERLARITSPPAASRRGGGRSGSVASENGSDADQPGVAGNDVYMRVKRNRERRLRASRAPARASPVSCPVCSLRLNSAEAERHVDACLRQSATDNNDQDDDESIDVEGDEGFGVTYEWCSQVRVRAAALQAREGGDMPHGAMRIRQASTDTNLVVDDADEDMYGPPQYSPNITNEETDENGIDDPGSSNMEVSQLLENRESEQNGTSTFQSRLDQSECRDIVMNALKARIRELEMQLSNTSQRTEQNKCLICMGPYTEPVVSIQCWHVHCEGCWLGSLGVKKMCPQCNAITTSQHLRRIYI